MNQNVSLGSNGVDQVCSLQKIPTRLRGTNFCINCTSSRILHRVSCSNETIPNAPKYYKGPKGWIGCVRCKKFLCDFVAQTFALVRPVLHRVSKGNQAALNAPKYYEIHQNVSLGSNGVDWVHSLRKIMTRLRGTNFSTSSACFVPSSVRQPNGPE